MSIQHHDPDPQARAAQRRRFGRWELLRLLGKSELTMAWQVQEPGQSRSMMLVLPRLQPADAQALETWEQAVRAAARLDHPQLAPVQEAGVQDGWPFVAHDLGDTRTLADLSLAKAAGPSGQPGPQGVSDRPGRPGPEVAEWGVQLLQGLAFAHDAGLAHHDLQPYLLLMDPHGGLRIAGLGVAAAQALVRTREPRTAGPADAATALRLTRSAAQQDVLAVGVLLHAWLIGRLPLDEPDVARVLQRLPPQGREVLSLPWTLAQPLADPMRAIVNRATQAQERLRYHNARTLLRALQGWLQTEQAEDAGPMVLLADRLRNLGVLPASPGAVARAARLGGMERQRSHELAEIVLQDPALSFELLRLVNTAQVRGAQLSGSGPVLTVRRAIALLGLDGVRRATQALRTWPGPLQPAGAQALQQEIERSQRAARLAVALRPPGYDSEVVYLITLLQNLGWLVVHYHFADEARQIHRLMQPQPPAEEGAPETPGLGEAAACYAVLGADPQEIGLAVARQWGFDDAVMHLIRRMPPGRTPRQLDTEEELLRCLASCAIESVQAVCLPAARQRGALQRVLQRWSRPLDLEMRDLLSALREPVHDAPRAPISQTLSAPLGDAETPSRPPAHGEGLRATLAARRSGVVS